MIKIIHSYSFFKQDIQRYTSTGHLPRGLVARIDMLHMAAFKRLQRMKDGN